jgi:hypothetical protein
MVNLTLIVQAAHFLIAYLILDRIFLRGAITQVRKEQLRDEALQHTLVATEQEVVLQQQTVQETWLAMQQRLLQQRPSIKSMPRASVSCRQTDHSDEISQQTCSRIYQQLTRVIVDRLSKLEKDS